jgi:hypothetical protein
LLSQLMMGSFFMYSLHSVCAPKELVVRSSTQLSASTTPTTTTSTTVAQRQAAVAGATLTPRAASCHGRGREASAIALAKERHFEEQRALRPNMMPQAKSMVAMFGLSHELWMLQVEYPCEHTVLVGNRFCDGAKFLCNPHWISQMQSCSVYSFGIAQNVQFETDLHQLLPHCVLHGFDPTPSVRAMEPVLQQLGGTFHSLGLSNTNSSIVLEGQSVPVYDLLTIRRVIGDNADVPITILKVDIEGHEWALMEQLISTCDRSAPYAYTLMLEIHLGMGQRVSGMPDLAAMGEGMARCGYRMVAKDPNHWDPLCVEVVWVHENFVQCNLN